MSVPGIHPDPVRVPSPLQPGRRPAIASFLMVPALVFSYVTAYFAGVAVQSAFGLAEDESLREAGVWGVVSGVLLIALIVVPQLVGIALGVRARRLGERRLGTAGVVVNAAIAAFLLLTSVLGLALG